MKPDITKLQQSFNNVKALCDEVRNPALNNAERQEINSSLKYLVDVLIDYMKIKKESQNTPEPSVPISEVEFSTNVEGKQA